MIACDACRFPNAVAPSAGAADERLPGDWAWLRPLLAMAAIYLVLSAATRLLLWAAFGRAIAAWGNARRLQPIAPLAGREVEVDQLDPVREVHTEPVAFPETAAAQPPLLHESLRFEHVLRAVVVVEYFDAQFALVTGDDQQGAVVLVLLADAPGTAELVAVVLQRGVRQRFQRDDDDLVAAGAALRSHSESLVFQPYGWGPRIERVVKDQRELLVGVAAVVGV